MGNGRNDVPDTNTLPDRAQTIPLADICRALSDRYGDPHWWPAESTYAVIVGAVLTQNTAWGNVEKALAGFGGMLSPEMVLAMPLELLEVVIRPAGAFRRKATTLKTVTAWFAGYGFDVARVQAVPLTVTRTGLLSLSGIGPETADAILLYAFGLPTFVVDAYTMRLCRRYPLPAGATYAAVKAYFEDHLPCDAELYNRLHAWIVINAKNHCRTRPICAGCPLEGTCARITP